MSSLMCCLVIDLCREWSPYIWASDGAESFGYGGCRARCAPAVVRQAASHAEKFPHQIVPADARGMVKNADMFALPVTGRDFKTVFSVRSRSGFHASRLEIGAFSMILKSIARDARRHRSRVLILTDSLAVLFGVRKGRSSAPNFAYGLRQVAA